MEKVVVETAVPADWTAVQKLLAASGLPLDGLREHFGQALVARNEEAVAGCAALELFGEAALLRSVAVAADYRGSGLGVRLTEAALAQAQKLGVREVYLLTETAVNYFPRFGFEAVARDAVVTAVRQSVEFTTACPDSAQAMRLRLSPAT